MAKNGNWDADAMRGTLISDMEQEVREGISSMPSNSAARETQVETEQTKGVQTYIPISQYRRLNDLKLTRGENIATLAAQAIAYWLDVQEGKV